jgi:hypothetical protein
MASAPSVPPKKLYELPFFGDRVVPVRHTNWGSLNFWQPPILSSPIVNVPGLDDVKPITLTSLTVDAKISGFLAKTTVYMSFYNPHDRTLEGELQFPLPDGATISGYGSVLRVFLIRNSATSFTCTIFHVFSPRSFRCAIKNSLNNWYLEMVSLELFF